MRKELSWQGGIRLAYLLYNKTTFFNLSACFVIHNTALVIISSSWASALILKKMLPATQPDDRQANEFAVKNVNDE